MSLELQQQNSLFSLLLQNKPQSSITAINIKINGSGISATLRDNTGAITMKSKDGILNNAEFYNKDGSQLTTRERDLLIGVLKREGTTNSFGAMQTAVQATLPLMNQVIQQLVTPESQAENRDAEILDLLQTVSSKSHLTFIKRDDNFGITTWQIKFYDIVYQITHSPKGGIQYFKKNEDNNNIPLTSQEITGFVDELNLNGGIKPMNPFSSSQLLEMSVQVDQQLAQVQQQPNSLYKTSPSSEDSNSEELFTRYGLSEADLTKFLKKTLKAEIKHLGSSNGLDSSLSGVLYGELMLPDTYLQVSSNLISIPNPNPINNSLIRNASLESNSSGGVNIPITNAKLVDVKILSGKKGENVKIEITEVTNDGEIEIYTVEYGTFDNETQDRRNGMQQKSGVKLTCSSGKETFCEFGESSSQFVTRKPVLVIRNFKVGTELDFEVVFDGKYDVIYPKPSLQEENKIVWNTKAGENNSLIVREKSYPYLFWDGRNNLRDTQIETGWCVAKDQILEFLEERCADFGFDAQLTTDFVTFWTPYLMQNKYSLIRWFSKEECQKLASLEVNSDVEFDTIRMYMVFQKTDVFVKISSQKLIKTEITKKPTVFDWGGFEI